MEWSDWPKTRWPLANVLCEGPSIKQFDKDDLLLGPTIAINHALSLDAPIDFWAFTDSPEFLWKWSEPFRGKALRYFTSEYAVWALAQRLEKDEVLKIYSADPIQVGNMENAEHNPVILPTISPVLAWLLHVGVKWVRLFGCDMQGAGSPISIEGYKAEESHGWYWRWHVERVLLAHTMRAYRAQSARIERWNKPKSRPRTSPSATTSASPTSSSS